MTEVTVRYLNMDSVPESFRKAGIGGVDRFRDLRVMRIQSFLSHSGQKIEEIKNMANVQTESFKTIGEKTRNGKGRWIISRDKSCKC